MRFGLLGPLEVLSDDGEVIVFAGNRERVMLAALLLGANRTVQTAHLIDALWGESPPARAANALQVQVSRLRRKLNAGTGRAEVLRGEPSGYRLVVEPGELDVARFEALLRSVDGPPAEVSARLAEALDVWRGPALVDVDSEALRANAVHLDGLRWMALGRRIDADLQLGRHQILVSELEALVAAQPLQEAFAGQLMVALYRCGRQADALAVYRRTREVLAEELGIDPSPYLGALELAVLNQSPELDSPVGAESTVRARPPSGTVTFMFTDVEASTRRLRDIGAQQYECESEAMRGVIRDAAAASAGFEMDADGDRFSVAFVRASDALEAAGEIQKNLAGGPVRVRIGLHTGEPLVVEGRYVGIDVHKAARICSAAHGGQVLMSQSTRDLVDADFKELGEFRLKDLARPERLFQLGDGEFSPPLGSRAGNLPIQTSPLLGRHQELHDLAALTLDHRLVTLTGPGGTGKTRLALQVAADLADRYPGGVWWVSLAGVSDAAFVLPTVAQALEVLGDLGEHLVDRELLIVVDNLEQVLAAAPSLGDLLSSAAGLRLLVTSRERLAIAGEQEYPVAPLDEAAASELFVTRAREVKPDFTPDRTVGEICRRLDRLPLALELAAPRVKLMTTSQILDRLVDRFDLLAGSRRDVHERQMTMRATIDWSYDLLPPGEQQVFRALGVFAGGFTLEAAEMVCWARVGQLQSLVDKSLVRRAEDGRFVLLETTREYALDRLRDTRELEEMQARHSEWFYQLAQASRVDLETHGGMFSLPRSPWAERLRAETDNFRAVLAWALQHDLPRGIQLAVSLKGTWLQRGQAREIARWWERALAAFTAVEPDLRAEALYGLATSLMMIGEDRRIAELLNESLQLFYQTGNHRQEACALLELGNLSVDNGALRQAMTYYEQALAIFRRIDEPSGVGHALNDIGAVLSDMGQLDEGEAALEEAINLAILHDSRSSLVAAKHTLGNLALARGDVRKAEQCYREALALAADPEERHPQLHCLAGLACVAALRTDAGGAGRLWTIVRTSEGRLGFRINPDELERYTKILALVESQPAYQTGVEAGRTISFEQAVHEQLGY
jgi:predicted ATPase/DNA-binding SARP family transcriptional activator